MEIKVYHNLTSEGLVALFILLVKYYSPEFGQIIVVQENYSGWEQVIIIVTIIEIVLEVKGKIINYLLIYLVTNNQSQIILILYNIYSIQYSFQIIYFFI